MYAISRLPNGFTVASAAMPHMASVSLGLWVGIGSRYEPPNLNGVCHFIEHLVFKGTAKRSAQAISQAVEGLGGYLNAFTSEELTCFHARVGHQHLGSVLEVLMDMLLEPALRQADLAKEREVIKEEISMYLDEPQHQVQELLNQVLWPNQPLGRPITGTPGTLDRMRRGDVRKFLSSHYLSENTLLVAAGRVDHAQLVRVATSFGRRFTPGARPAFPAAVSRQDEPRTELITKDTEQTQIALGIRTCCRFDPRRHSLRLLNTILGENMSSRLFQVIREDRGLAYSVYSAPSFFADDGDLVISAGLDIDNLSRVLKLIIRELNRLKTHLVPQSELRRARDYVIGQMALSLESTESQMNWVGEQLLGYGKVLRPLTIEKRLAAVTAQDLRDAARWFFRPERLSLAVVSSLKEVSAASRLLRDV